MRGHGRRARPRRARQALLPDPGPAVVAGPQPEYHVGQDPLPGDKRIALIALVLAEIGLAALTWRDIRNRPAEEIRGSKRLWRVISAINPGNSVAYWLVGRKYGRSRPA